MLTKGQSQAHWIRLLSDTRFAFDERVTHPNNTRADEHRSAFQTDYDRVVFSLSFRKLGRKTQVHPLAKSDHTHNRLTHSVEVASVGRTLGNTVGNLLSHHGYLPHNRTPNDVATIVQVACLAHDLGNPPFGHAGEDALRQWFCENDNARYLAPLSDKQRSDISTYEGNAHTFRIVCNLEMYHNHGGMRLTAASLGAMIKYPWGSLNAKKHGKFNIYHSEMPLMRALCDTLGLVMTDEDSWLRHPLSYLMEAADDICYALLDLEDAVELGLLGIDEFAQIVQPIVSHSFANLSDSQRLGALRGVAIGKIAEDVAKSFMHHHDELLMGQFTRDLLEAATDETQAVIFNAKQLARTRIFHHETKLASEIATFNRMAVLLDMLIPAVYELHHAQTVNHKHALALKLLDKDGFVPTELYQDYMRVLDFIGGLTDNSLARLVVELTGFDAGK